MTTVNRVPEFGTERLQSTRHADNNDGDQSATPRHRERRYRYVVAGAFRLFAFLMVVGDSLVQPPGEPTGRKRKWIAAPGPDPAPGRRSEDIDLVILSGLRRRLARIVLKSSCHAILPPGSSTSIGPLRH